MKKSVLGLIAAVLLLGGVFAADEKAKPAEDENLRFRDWFEALPAAEQSELRDLRDSDPEKFKETLRRRLPKVLLERFEEREAQYKLGEKYRAAATDEEREAIKAELKERVEKGYRALLKRQRVRLDEVRKELNELEAQHKERSENIEEKVDLEVERIISLASEKEEPAA